MILLVKLLVFMAAALMSASECDCNAHCACPTVSRNVFTCLVVCQSAAPLPITTVAALMFLSHRPWLRGRQWLFHFRRFPGKCAVSLCASLAPRASCFRMIFSRTCEVLHTGIPVAPWTWDLIWFQRRLLNPQVGFGHKRT